MLDSRNNEELRATLKRIMADKKLKVRPWAKKANLSEGALRSFLNGTHTSLTVTSIEKLASGVEMTTAELMSYGKQLHEPETAQYMAKTPPLAAGSSTLPAKKEEIWWMGNLSPTVKCKILATGDLGIDEIQNLLTALEQQRDLLLRDL